MCGIMDELNTRIDEYFDEEGKIHISKYLNKCLTRYFKSKVKEHRKRLENEGVPANCVERECLWNMAGFGLITIEEAKRRMKTYE